MLAESGQPMAMEPPHHHTRERVTSSSSAEDDLRHSMVHVLLEAGERLRLPQETTATAIVVFHRFLLKRRLQQYEESGRLPVLVTTCLFLAAKVEEHPRRLRDVINTVYFVRWKPPPLKGASENGEKQAGSGVGGVRGGGAEAGVMRLDKEYLEMKDKVVDMEQLVLRVLAFDVDTFQVYRLLLNYARSLRCRPVVVQTAWAFVTDSLYVPACHLSTPQQAVACAALYMAQVTMTDGSKDDHVPVAENGQEGRGWYVNDDGGETAIGGSQKEVTLTPEVWTVLGACTADVERVSADLVGSYERKHHDR